MLLYTLACLCLVACGAQAMHSTGPYDLVFKYWEHCPDQGTGEFIFSDNINKKSSTVMVYNESFTFPFPVGEGTALRLEIAKWGSRGWGLNAYELEQEDICEALRQLGPDPFKRLMKSMGITASCPIPEGVYQCFEFELVAVLEGFPCLHYGEYRCDIIFSKNEERFGCIRMYGDIVEKITKIPSMCGP